MDAAHALGGRCESGGLYESEGRYRLLMGESPTDVPEHILSEFGTPIDSPFSASHTREHWRCISERDALKRLFGG